MSHPDTTRDENDWRGSRRTLLASVAGLGLSPMLRPGGWIATPVASPATECLRDFAYVCAALVLAAHEQADLEPLAGVRYQTSVLVLTPEAAVAALGWGDEAVRRIFAAGARQLYAYVAVNQVQLRSFVINLVEAATSEGAETIFQELSKLWPQEAMHAATPDEAPDADSSFVGAVRGAQTGVDQDQAQNWLFGGVRFGSLAVIWQVGFQAEMPDPALAAPINRVLRDYLTDQGASSRRGASLAFLLTIPAQPHIAVGQTILDGTVLGYADWDDATMHERQVRAASAGVVNELSGSFRGPGRLAPNMFIEEFATAEQARQFVAMFMRDEANDQNLGVARRPLGADEFSLTGWDDWQASAIRVQQGQHGALGMSVAAHLGAFGVYVEVLDDVSSDAAAAPPGRGDAALRAWSAMAHQLLEPAQAAARNPPDAAGRAIFPPPLPAFADPLAR